MSRLQDRVELVTGAGHGIGRAFAGRFGAEGAAVVVAEKITAGGGRARAAVTDVTDPATGTRVVAETVTAWDGSRRRLPHALDARPD